MRHHYTNKYFQHTCHKTDPNADGYIGGKVRECRGHIQMMMNEWNKTPGRGGVYDKVPELIETYPRNWLGNEQYEDLKQRS